MGFGEAVKLGITRYFDFSGRSSRPEYWWFALFMFLVSIVGTIIDVGLGRSANEIGPFGLVTFLATLIPSLSVSVRRLHDIDKSGWWLLICFIPIIGWILLIYWACQPGLVTTRFDGQSVHAA